MGSIPTRSRQLAALVVLTVTSVAVPNGRIAAQEPASEVTAAPVDTTPPAMPLVVRRHATGHAVYRIERAAIAARAPVSSWQLLQGLPWVQLAEVPVSGVVVHGRRAFTVTPASMKPCYTRVAIDGVVMSDAPMDVARFLPTVHEIETLEIFTGPATIPHEYAGLTRDMGCGLIAIWTH